MKRFLAVLVLVLLAVTMTACSPSSKTVPPIGEAVVAPQAEDATGSLFLGEWTVTAKISMLDKIHFQQNGTLQAYFDGHQLAGVFFEDGNTIKIHISQQVIEGTFTVNDDTVTIVTDTDLLVLKKAA